MKYNCDFEVKYYSIEQELLKKCIENGEEDYTQQDVIDICEKLYRDELMSVFDMDAMNDMDDMNAMNDMNAIDKINECVLELFKTTLADTQLSIMVNEIAEICYGDFLSNPHMKNDIQHMIFITAFNYQIFHLMHQCISQQIKWGQIDCTLMEQCKYLICKFITTCNS